MWLTFSGSKSPLGLEDFLRDDVEMTKIPANVGISFR